MGDQYKNEAIGLDLREGTGRSEASSRQRNEEYLKVFVINRAVGKREGRREGGRGWLIKREGGRALE